MKRSRFLILLTGGASLGRPGSRSPQASPTDESKLNGFATHYNRYVEALRSGLVDLKEWRRVQRAWETLEG